MSTARMTFTVFEVELLKLAATETKTAAKAASGAASKAYLTEAQSAADELGGYAEEAVMFLEKPEEDGCHLSFGHRTALRTGCLIKIKKIRGIVEDQQESLVDGDGIAATEKRVADYQRLESRLRKPDDPQTDLDLDSPTPTPSPTDGADDASLFDEDGFPIVGEGPFDAGAIRPLRMLPSAQPDETEDDIPDAVVDDDDIAIDDAGDDDEEPL